MKASEAQEIDERLYRISCILEDAFPNPHNEDEKKYLETVDKARSIIDSQYKYRWHDLRKNPEDLPDDFVWVYVADQNDDESMTYTIAYTGGDKWHDVDSFVGVWNVVAWRYIEPFEKEES